MDEETGSTESPLSEAEHARLTASIETVLFMSDRPVSLPRLRAIIDATVPLSAYRALLTGLRDDSARDHRGIEIAEVSLGFQLRTKPHLAPVLRKMVRTQPLKLTPTGLETLSIVAYKQPITKDELDRIRGVDSGYVLRSLMEKKLVRITGRSDLPGRPLLYGTTHEFLELFSLRDLKSLPALHEVESLVAASEVGSEEQEHQALRDFSKMVESDRPVLFDDSEIDADIETLRAEIARIETSTPYIEEQKAQAKAEGNTIPIPADAPAPEPNAEPQA